MNLFSFFIVAMIVMCLFALVGTIFGETDSSKNEVGKSKIGKKGTTFNIISSKENEDLENVVKDYAKSKGYKVNFQYEGTLDMMDVLNSNSANYDAVWSSNSIWLYMLDSKVKISDSGFTSINPIVLAIKKSQFFSSL